MIRDLLAPRLNKIKKVHSKIPKKGLKIGVALLLAAILATSLGMYIYERAFVFVVYLDDNEVGMVSDGNVILDFVADLVREEEDRYGLDVEMVQEVTVARERRSGAQVDEWMVKDFLRRSLQFDVYAHVIMVNDKPTLAVRTMDDYSSVLQDLKDSFVRDAENTVVQNIVLNDKVEPVKTLVDPDALYSAETAAEILRRGTDRREVYLVSRGDSLWTIARNNNMAVEQIIQANPQLVESDRLQIGDELSLVVAEPLVHVTVTEDVVLVERIPFETKYQNDSKMYKGATKIITPGQYGYREVTYRITRVDDREFQREVIDEKVVEEPQTQVVARGTAAAPVSGNGRFIWPVAGGGRITSRYGYRGRSFHRGVDIGTATGTAILAADSGTVTYAGWSGGYGILVVIDHGNGYITKYAHNSALLVSVGSRVQKGQQIAKSGSTGNSTGPHLHFEIMKNGTNINPLQFF
jgi:murein DD-endopeptidase MepM/ murein hydrolase activator NlpD